MDDPVWKTPEAELERHDVPAAAEAREPEPDRPLAPPPWKRLAVTIAVPAAIVVAGHVTLPGLDRGRLLEMGDLMARTPGLTSIAAVGILPYLSAFVIIELLALVVPSWRARRHGGAEGRARLRWMAMRAGVLLAALQSVFMAMQLERSGLLAEPGMASRVTITLVLTAVSFGIAQLTRVVEELGLGNGFAVVLASSWLAQLEGLALGVGGSDLSSLMSARVLPETPMQYLFIAIAGALTYFAVTGRSLAGRARTGEGALAGAAGAGDLRIPLPACGLIATRVAASVLATIAVLPSFGVNLPGELASELHPGTVAYAIAVISSSILLAVFFAWLFNLPANVAAVVRAFGAARKSEVALDEEVARALRAAILRTVAFVAFFLAADHFAAQPASSPFAALIVATCTALAADLAAEWRARRREPDLVAIHPEHRPYAVAAVRHALHARGIFVYSRGLYYRTLLQFFGPYVPIDLMVPRRDAAAAREVLR